MKIINFFKNQNIQSFLCGLLGGLVVFIIFGINYTLTGSLVEWIGALGTAGAVIVSLWLVFRKERFNIQLLMKSGNKQEKDNDGVTIGLNKSAVTVRAYNAGETTVGINFMGFKSRRLAQKPNEDGYIRSLFEEIKGPDLEFISPGNPGKEYILESDLLQGIDEKYKEKNGELILEAVFIDIRGKEHTQEIIIPKDWK